MQGSNFQRVARLAGDFIRHPQYIGRYLTTSIPKSTPLDLQLPWFSYAAIDFLGRFLRPSMRTFEYGGGGSTIFFARRTAQVVCVESSEAWANKIRHVLDAEKMENVKIEVHAYDPNDRAAFGRSGYLRTLEKETPDIVVVDGYEEGVPLRPDCFWLAETVIRPGGIIIVDDSWRYPELRKKNRSKKWIEFRSVGPCRLGVTSTDIYFY